MVEICRESPDQPDVRALIQALDADLLALYPAESCFGLAVTELVENEVRFFVARIDGVAIGCGGYSADEAGGGELRRMFVDPRARGRGVGRQLLTTLETSARGEGVTTMRLETGPQSIEAVGLYRRFGYRERGPFGRYQLDPHSVFMEKRFDG